MESAAFVPAGRSELCQDTICPSEDDWVGSQGCADGADGKEDGKKDGCTEEIEPTPFTRPRTLVRRSVPAPSLIVLGIVWRPLAGQSEWAPTCHPLAVSSAASRRIATMDRLLRGSCGRYLPEMEKNTDSRQRSTANARP